MAVRSRADRKVVMARLSIMSQKLAPFFAVLGASVDGSVNATCVFSGATAASTSTIVEVSLSGV